MAKFGISLLNYRPGRVGGVETYIRKLIERFADGNQTHDIRFIVSAELARMLPEQARTHVISASGNTLILWRCLEAFTPLRASRIAREIDAARYDALLFPQQSIFPIGIQTPAVLTVVDLQHLHHPEHYGRFDTAFRRTIYPRSLARSRRVIAISEATAKDLVSLCGVAAEKIEVIHLGFEAAPVTSRTARVVDGPYLYYPAATFPHKGHAALLRCFARLKATEQRDDLKLVFSGMQTALWKKLRKQVRALGLEDAVLHMGFVPYDHVVSLYQHAQAILFPSEFEGFGMPVLEATRFEKPIFCSDLPVFEELGVPDGNRRDFTDPDALLGIMDHLQPTHLLKRPITWDECAERTVHVLVEATTGDQSVIHPL